ncbi:hypothetical protein GJ629_03790 [Halapricum sp. CBA1109]|nr:hypothetical protein [Halapricum sp. CBA1109]
MAGCNTSDSPDETPTENETTSTQDGTPPGTETDEPDQTEDDQQTEEDPETAVRYFFEDETGALGHLADDETPENYDHVITNTATEAEYQEMQRNDRAFAEDAASNQRAPQGEGLNMTVDEMIARAEEIYNNPAQEFEGPVEAYDIDFTQEDNEITFTRALVKASRDAGVTSSGLANIVVANIAEDAVQQIQPGFNDFKLSTLPATEAVNPGYGGKGGAERTNEFNQTYINSGFLHMPAVLQYQKDGETEVKYTEQTDPLDVNIFRRVIRDPESSVYRSNLEQDTVAVSRDSEPGDTGSMFPEHYVTAFDYTKARQLESEGVLGMGENDDGGINAVGDYLVQTMMHTIDDMGITGYDNNPDRKNKSLPTDGKLVSDEFGESIEDYVLNPTSEKRNRLQNVSRGIYQVFQEHGWNSSIAITGTLEDPEILPTDQDTVNQVRQDQAYDQVRERVAG